MIIYGTHSFGKTDVLQGVFDVRTQFQHIWFIPLIPVKSFLVLETFRDGSFHGVELGFYWRSVLLGWARGFSAALLLAALCFGPFHLMDTINTPNTDVLAAVLHVVGAGAAGVLGVIAAFGPWSTKISRERAIALGTTHLGIPEDEMSRIWTMIQRGEPLDEVFAGVQHDGEPQAW